MKNLRNQQACRWSNIIWCVVGLAFVGYIFAVISVDVNKTEVSVAADPSPNDYILAPSIKELEKNPRTRSNVKLTDPSLFQSEEAIEKYYSDRLSTVRDLIALWPPEVAGVDSVPSDWVDLVPRFDWNNEASRAAALKVRQSERPFIMRNVPSVLDANEKWTDQYLLEKLGTRTGKVEKSNTNSFMFWRQDRKMKNNGEPGFTEWVQMKWSVFRDYARKIDVANKPKEPHYYWHIHGGGPTGEWIKKDLDLFDKDNSFFIVDPSEYTVPIACRVGTRGLCNENHYDTHRTFAAQIVGSKRWIFMPPSMCSKLYLYPRTHMSSRHSMVDINSGKINETKYPLTGDALAIDTIVHAGEVAYLPSNWFHHIISQEYNIQCIARSGHSGKGNEDIHKCGF